MIDFDDLNEDQLLKKGNGKLFLNNYIEAIEFFSKLINLNPNNWEAFFGRGKAKFGLKNYEGAITDFTDGISLEPREIYDFYIERGLSYKYLNNIESSEKDFSMAIYYLNQLIELIPKNELAIFKRGFAKENIYDYPAAIDDYTKLIKLNSENDIAWFRRGLVKEKVGQIIESINDYLEAIKINPNKNDYYEKNFLNVAKLKIKNKEDYEKVNKLQEKIYLKIGCNLFEKEEYSNTIKFCKKVLDINSNNLNALIKKGMTYERLNFLRNALKDYQKAIELDPKQTFLINKISTIKNEIKRNQIHSYKFSEENKINSFKDLSGKKKLLMGSRDFKRFSEQEYARIEEKRTLYNYVDEAISNSNSFIYFILLLIITLTLPVTLPFLIFYNQSENESIIKNDIQSQPIQKSIKSIFRE